MLLADTATLLQDLEAGKEGFMVEDRGTWPRAYDAVVGIVACGRVYQVLHLPRVAYRL